MPFSAERTDLIKNRIRERLDGDSINDWERSFLTDMADRFDRHGERTSLSRAQYSKLHSVLNLKSERKPDRPAAKPKESPTKAQRRRFKPAQASSTLRSVKRTVNAPKRAVRRAQRESAVAIMAIFVVLGFFASVIGPTSNGSSTVRTSSSSESVGVAYISGSSVNQREGPSTSFPVIGSLARGTEVQVIGQEGQWTQIRSDLGAGWMSSNYVSSRQATPQPTTTSAPVGAVRASRIGIVDGDTIKVGGQSYRLLGFDTPETYYADCPAEKARGDAATARLRQLIRSADTVQLLARGDLDRYGRGLARLLVDGRDIGPILIGEGLARPYGGGQRRGWC